MPELAGCRAELLRYTREDGVPLSGMLYLPPGYRPERGRCRCCCSGPTRNEFKSPARRVRSAPRPTASSAPTAGSPLFFAARATPCSTVRRCPSSAKARRAERRRTSSSSWPTPAPPIAALDARGVADPNRVGVGGHCYGAFMTANLLAHTRSVPGRDRPQRGLQPHPDPFRLPGRDRGPVGGDRPLPRHVPVPPRRPDQGPAAADPRRGGQQRRHLPDAERAPLRRPEGPRRRPPASCCCPTRATATWPASRCCTPCGRA